MLQAVRCAFLLLVLVAFVAPVHADAVRTIIVSVTDEQNRPLPGARVLIETEHGNASNNTDSNGFAIARSSPLVIGDMVRVTIIANGYQRQSKNVVLGSLQPDREQMNLPRSVTNITAADFVRFQLRRAVYAPSVTIEVLQESNNRPIAGAQVTVVSLSSGGKTFQSITDKAGLTAPLLLPPAKATATGAAWRVKVKRSGYRERWSDIPQELIAPGPTRRYVVYLTAGAPPSVAARPTVAPSTRRTRIDLNGTWDGKIGYAQYLGRTLVIRQSGNSVTGEYTDNYTNRQERGRIQGTISGSRLIFQYSAQNGTGTGEFEIFANDLAGFFIPRNGTKVVWSATRRK